MNKKFNSLSDLVYSTNPEINVFQNSEEENIVPVLPEKQMLYVALEKKNRGGKEATVITNFIGNESELVNLAKIIKTKCGVGGAAKNGEIIVQGDLREKVIKILSELGFKTKRKGG